jgi:hypothetical protein
MSKPKEWLLLSLSFLSSFFLFFLDHTYATMADHYDKVADHPCHCGRPLGQSGRAQNCNSVKRYAKVAEEG